MDLHLDGAGVFRGAPFLPPIVAVLLLLLSGSGLEGQSPATSAAWVDTVIVTGEVTEAGALSARVSQRVRGSGHSAALAFLRSPGNETARAYIRALASDLGLGGRMRDIALELPKETADPLAVGFRARVEGYVDPSADTSMAALPFPSFVGSAGSGDRSEPSFAAGDDRTRKFFARIRIEFPASMDCCVPPTPTVVEEEDLTFRSSARVEGNVLVATRTLSVDAGALGDEGADVYASVRRAATDPVGFSVAGSPRSRSVPDADDPDELATAGLAARGDGRFGRALSLLERAVELRPAHGTAWKYLGTTYLRLNRLAEAEAAFRKQIEIDPGVPHAYASLAISLDRQGKGREAEAVYRRQLELEPRDSYAIVGLASLLVYEGRSEEAASLLARTGGADEIDTGDAELQVTLGWTLIHSDQAERAIPVLRKVIESDSTMAGARAYLGRALRRTGSTGEALPHLHAAVELAPGRAEYRVDLARALWETGGDDEALSMLREGRRRSPDHRALCMALGHTLTRLGRGAEAPECYSD